MLQFNKHVALAVALLVVVAEAVGGAPGTTQEDWQVADCELQLIMQLVTVEVCASRILSAAKALTVIASIASAAKMIVNARMNASPQLPNTSAMIARRHAMEEMRISSAPGKRNSQARAHFQLI